MHSCAELLDLRETAQILTPTSLKLIFCCFRDRHALTWLETSTAEPVEGAYGRIMCTLNCGNAAQHLQRSTLYSTELDPAVSSVAVHWLTVSRGVNRSVNALSASATTDRVDLSLILFPQWPAVPEVVDAYL